MVKKLGIIMARFILNFCRSERYVCSLGELEMKASIPSIRAIYIGIVSKGYIARVTICTYKSSHL